MDSFLKECKYNNVLKLYADEYPKFEKMTRYRNTVSIEGQEKLSYEDEMKERDASDSDNDTDDNDLTKNEDSEPGCESQFELSNSITGKKIPQKKKAKSTKKSTKKNRAPNPILEEIQDSDHEQPEQGHFLVKDEFHVKNPFLKTEYDFPTPIPEVLNAVNLPRGLNDKKGIDNVHARMLGQLPFDKAFLEQRIGKPVNNYSAALENLGNFIRPMNPFSSFEANNTMHNNGLQNLLECGQHELPLKNPELMNYFLKSDRGLITQEEDIQKLQSIQNIQNLYGNSYFETTKLFNEMNQQPVFKNNGLYKFEGRSKGKDQISENGLYFESHNLGIIKEESGKNENQQDVGNTVRFEANPQVKYENTYEMLPIHDRQIKIEDHFPLNNSHATILTHFENLARNKIMLENTQKKIKLA